MESEDLPIDDNMIIVDIIKILHQYTELPKYELQREVEFNMHRRLPNIDLIHNEHIFKNQFKIALDYRLIKASKVIDSGNARVRLYMVNYDNHVSKKIIYGLKGLNLCDTSPFHF